MGYLLKKMLRDIRSNWTQFVSVFLMAMLSVLIFSGMASVWTGLNSEVDEYVDKTNMADMWIRAASVTDEDIAELKKIDDIEMISRSMNISFAVKDSDSELQVNVVDSLDVSNLLLMEGDSYDNNAKEGIWIDTEYAKEHNIEIGDKILLDGFLGEVEFEVKGTIMSPEYIYYTGNIAETIPNYKKYGYAFVSESGMLQLTHQIVYSQAKLKVNGNIEDKVFEEILGERYICVQDRDNYAQFSRVSQESSQMQKMATLFSVVFILLALMTMYTSMVRLVNRQKMLIGTLKAIGMSEKSIRLHYIGYGLVIPIIGGILGLIVGRYTVSPILMKVKQTTIYLPEWKLEHSILSFILIGVIAICCVFASVWATQKCLKGMPVEIMRNNMEIDLKKVNTKKNSFMEKISYEWRWTIRNILQNKIRFFMGIVGVMGGMILLIAGLGVQDAITGSNDFVFSKQYCYETKALLNTAGKTFDWNDGLQWIQESNIEMRIKQKDVKQSVLTICDKGDMIRFYNDNDEEILLPDEGAVISRKLANDMEIEVGDIVEVRVFGLNEWVGVEIVEISKTLSPQGIFMSKIAYEELSLIFTPSAMLTSSNDIDVLYDKEEVKSVITINQQIENTNVVADSVMSVVKLLIMASIILGVVILYNLGVLNYVERIRDYATMKVLGFYQKEIRSIAIRECILTTLIGWILGLPSGILFLKIYIKIISFDTFEWISVVNPFTLVIASMVIVGVSFAVNLTLSAKVKKIVMVEALKSVE